jgi:hypothetical protein
MVSAVARCAGPPSTKLAVLRAVGYLNMQVKTCIRFGVLRGFEMLSRRFSLLGVVVLRVSG